MNNKLAIVALLSSILNRRDTDSMVVFLDYLEESRDHWLHEASMAIGQWAVMTFTERDHTQERVRRIFREIDEGLIPLGSPEDAEAALAAVLRELWDNLRMQLRSLFWREVACIEAENEAAWLGRAMLITNTFLPDEPESS